MEAWEYFAIKSSDDLDKNLCHWEDCLAEALSEESLGSKPGGDKT